MPRCPRCGDDLQRVEPAGGEEGSGPRYPTWVCPYCEAPGLRTDGAGGSRPRKR